MFLYLKSLNSLTSKGTKKKKKKLRISSRMNIKSFWILNFVILKPLKWFLMIRNLNIKWIILNSMNEKRRISNFISIRPVLSSSWMKNFSRVEMNFSEKLMNTQNHKNVLKLLKVNMRFKFESTRETRARDFRGGNCFLFLCELRDFMIQNIFQ